MAVLSTLQTQVAKEKFAQFAKVYSKHRPAVQRCLNIAFVIYTLGSTYLSLTSRSGKSSDEGGRKSSRRSKGKGGEGNKPVKVAVCDCGIVKLPSS